MPMTADPASSTFERYAADVYRWAYRLLGRHHDALDVVQDVYLKWSAQCEQQIPVSPRSWLRRVAVNRAIDLRRHRRITPLQMERTPETASVQHNPPSLIDEETLRDDMTAALSRLSDIQRNILLAKVYDELTFSKIAEETGTAVSTVKTHYLRAVKSLRNQLSPKWDDQQ